MRRNRREGEPCCEVMMGERVSTYFTDREYGARPATIDVINERLWAGLARFMSVSVATIRSWGASGASEEPKRAMTPTARRLLFVLLALQREGHDLDALRSAARRLEREHLEGDA